MENNERSECGWRFDALQIHSFLLSNSPNGVTHFRIEE